MAVVLASGFAAGDSSDIVATAGTPVTVFLSVTTDVPVPTGADCDIKVKDAGGKYHTIGKVTGRNPAVVIDAPGTYRVSRLAGAPASEAFAVETA